MSMLSFCRCRVDACIIIIIFSSENVYRLNTHRPPGRLVVRYGGVTIEDEVADLNHRVLGVTVVAEACLHLEDGLHVHGSGFVGAVERRRSHCWLVCLDAFFM